MSDAESSEKKPVLKKLIVLGGGGLLVLALVGGGGFYGWKKWQASKAAKAEATPKPGEHAAEGEAAAEEEEPEASEEAGPAPVFVYKTNVNLDGRKNAYLVVELNILFRDPEVGRLVTSDKPTPENSIMRALILDALSGKTLEEVSDLEAREIISQDILDRLNERFAPKPPKKGEEEDHKKPKKPIKEVLVVAWAIAQ